LLLSQTASVQMVVISFSLHFFFTLRTLFPLFYPSTIFQNLTSPKETNGGKRRRYMGNGWGWMWGASQLGLICGKRKCYVSLSFTLSPSTSSPPRTCFPFYFVFFNPKFKSLRNLRSAFGETLTLPSRNAVNNI